MATAADRKEEFSVTHIRHQWAHLGPVTSAFCGQLHFRTRLLILLNKTAIQLQKQCDEQKLSPLVVNIQLQSQTMITAPTQEHFVVIQ